MRADRRAKLAKQQLDGMDDLDGDLTRLPVAAYTSGVEETIDLDEKAVTDDSDSTRSGASEKKTRVHF